MNRFRRLVYLIPLLVMVPFSFGFWGFGENVLQARTEKKHFREQNKQKSRTRGAKRFMLTQKAEQAQIEMHPDDDESLLITLKNVDPLVTYYKVEPNRNYGILSIKQYMWYCHFGKSMFSKDNPRGALGYLSFQDEKKEDSLSFNVFQLNKPKYNRKTRSLTYQVDALPGFIIDKLEFGDVILTIDLTVN